MTVLRQMLPVLTLDNQRDVLAGHVVLSGKAAQRCTGSIFLANINNLTIREFGRRIGFAGTAKLLIRLCSILCIRCVVASVQVRMVTARSIVALVANARTFWNWPDKMLESQPMSKHALPFAIVQCAIPVLYRSRPLPTGFRITNHEAIKKALHDGQRTAPVYMRRNEPQRFSLYMPPPGVRPSGYRGKLSTSALAVSVRGCVHG